MELFPALFRSIYILDFSFAIILVGLIIKIINDARTPNEIRYGTIVGWITALVSLLLFAILVNIFYPIISANMGNLDPSIQALVDFIILLIGISIVYEIIQDATAGRQPVYGQ